MGNQVTLSGHWVTFSGNQVTFSGNQVTFSEHQVTIWETRSHFQVIFSRNWVTFSANWVTCLGNQVAFLKDWQWSSSWISGHFWEEIPHYQELISFIVSKASASNGSKNKEWYFFGRKLWSGLEPLPPPPTKKYPFSDAAPNKSPLACFTIYLSIHFLIDIKIFSFNSHLSIFN